MIKPENLNHLIFYGNAWENFPIDAGRDDFVLVTFLDSDGESQECRLYKSTLEHTCFRDSLSRECTLDCNREIQFKITKCHSDRHPEDYFKAVDVRYSGR
jgi:hypothetical protein